MQLPAQVIDQRGPLTDQPLAMISQLTDLKRPLIQLRGRQLVQALLQRRTRNR